jgi:hypothetical protein
VEAELFQSKFPAIVAITKWLQCNRCNCENDRAVILQRLLSDSAAITKPLQSEFVHSDFKAIAKRSQNYRIAVEESLETNCRTITERQQIDDKATALFLS